MQGAIVAIQELAGIHGVGEATAVQECREREVPPLGDQQIGEELQELRARLNFAACCGMKGNDWLKAPGPRWHATPCGFEPLQPCAPVRAPPTTLAVGWR